MGEMINKVREELKSRKSAPAKAAQDAETIEELKKLAEPEKPKKAEYTRLFGHKSKNGTRVGLFCFETSEGVMYRVSTVLPDGEVDRRDFSASQFALKLRTKRKPKK